MRIPLRNRYFFVGDVLLIPVAVYLSFVLRLEDWLLDGFLPGFIVFAGLGLLITIIVFNQAGVYARYWRYASVEELLLLIGAVTAASLLTGGASVLASLVLPPTVVVPRSIAFIFLFLALAATAGPRLFVRMLSGYERGLAPASTELTPVLIVGAGSAGTMIQRELRRNRQTGLHIAGFVDDDPAKQNVNIQGSLVLGTRDDIPRLVREHAIGQVVIAMPTAPGKEIRNIVSICERAGVKAKIIPAIYDLLDGKVSVNQIRDVQIEDLLRRKAIRTDVSAVGELIRGRRVLITGGGGSIGSELCRQVLRFEPAQLIIVGHGENSIFTIQGELQKQLPRQIRLDTVIADIRFPERIRAIFEQFCPEIVFHAAAHKHVPLMEHNISEAITNNVLGTRNLLNASVAAGVQHFVMISTDKAVNPTSVMGASKRAAELLVHKVAVKTGRPYVAVRFGNVLGSRGSVVLTFKQQIAAGGPVTVTHPEMQRYFMTIPEAVQLVLQAATIGKGGEVFTLDMGEPVKIVDLARDMIELSGLEVGRDIEIAFSGLRPGEKLYEELFVPGEVYERTHHDKIFIAFNASNFVPHSLDEVIADLEAATLRHDELEAIAILKHLVPHMRRPVDVPVEAPATRVELPVQESLHMRVVGGV